jgi:4-amino-4-deoxy-L-arabinose transferase-like glycosyltransferase
MLDFSTDREQTITPAKAWLLALLCAVWIGTGLVGHDPWKPDEASSFGLVYHILHSGDWLVPAIAGEPYMDKPPLFYWTAAASAKLFSPALALHDGARLASGLYTLLTLLFTGLAARELFGKGQGWSTAVILIGCLGMLVRAHQMITDLALLAGCALMLYGYALAVRFQRHAGLLLGTGLGIGFLSKGFIAPMLFLLIGTGLLAFRYWRTRYFLATLALALLCALPWLAIWPWLLYQRSPQLFMEWAWHDNIGHWLNYAQHYFGRDAWYYLNALPWLAWPAWPLALWAAWRARGKLRYDAEYQLLLIVFGAMLIALSFVPNIKEVYALPMLLPLALLATAALPSLRRGAANALDWFGIMTFALLGILLWWGWAGLLLDNHAKITLWLKDYQPGFEPVFRATPFWIAVVFSVLWITLVWRVGRSIRRSVINWAAGTTLIWILAMTLWLPWLDNGKSYRGMVMQLKAALPAHYNCIGRISLGDSQRAMLDYFGGITTRHDAHHTCDLALVQGTRYIRPLEASPAWKKIWEGGRPGDKGERYRLYRRQPTNKS